MLLACQRELLHLGLSTCRSVRLLREDLCHWEAEYFFWDSKLLFQNLMLVIPLCSLMVSCCFAEIWTSALLSTIKDSWVECTHPRRSFIWISCWWVGKATSWWGELSGEPVWTVSMQSIFSCYVVNVFMPKRFGSLDLSIGGVVHTERGFYHYEIAAGHCVCDDDIGLRNHHWLATCEIMQWLLLLHAGMQDTNLSLAKFHQMEWLAALNWRCVCECQIRCWTGGFLCCCSMAALCMETSLVFSSQNLCSMRCGTELIFWGIVVSKMQ